MLYIHTIEYYTVIKKSKLLIHIVKWVNLTDIIFGKVKRVPTI